MIVPGYTIAVGREKGEGEKDQEGMLLAKTPRQKMAWLTLKKGGTSWPKMLVLGVERPFCYLTSVLSSLASFWSSLSNEWR